MKVWQLQIISTPHMEKSERGQGINSIFCTHGVPVQSKLRKQIASNYGEHGFNRRKILEISLQNQIALPPIVLGLPGRKRFET
jgi:hypothetical protein